MKYIAFILLLLFSSCSIQEYKNSEAKVITIKTPKLKFSDLGYVRNSGDAVAAELFVAGNIVQKIEINHLVCVNEGCMSKSGFNEEYLNHNYPDDLLQNVISGNPIYNGKDMSKTSQGFEQRIRIMDVDILYRVEETEIFFKDRKNNIILKFKEINNE